MSGQEPGAVHPRPEARERTQRAFLEFWTPLQPVSTATVLMHGDVDGLGAGALLTRSLRASGAEVVPLATGKGEGAWTPEVQARVAATAPEPCSSPTSAAARIPSRPPPPCSSITIGRLCASAKTMAARLRVREPGIRQAEFLERSRHLDGVLTAAALEHFTVANDERPITDVAREFLAYAGWV